MPIIVMPGAFTLVLGRRRVARVVPEWAHEVTAPTTQLKDRVVIFGRQLDLAQHEQGVHLASPLADASSHGFGLARRFPAACDRLVVQAVAAAYEP